MIKRTVDTTSDNLKCLSENSAPSVADHGRVPWYKPENNGILFSSSKAVYCFATFCGVRAGGVVHHYSNKRVYRPVHQLRSYPCTPLDQFLCVYLAISSSGGTRPVTGDPSLKLSMLSISKAPASSLSGAPLFATWWSALNVTICTTATTAIRLLTNGFCAELYPESGGFCLVVLLRGPLGLQARPLPPCFPWKLSK